MPPHHQGFPHHLTRIRLNGLYVITSSLLGPGHREVAAAALAGGAKVLQLRDKGSSAALLPLALALCKACREAGALFIVNDSVELALACGADGVHLGPDDLPVATARRITGPHFLIGASCANPAEALEAERAGADYIGAGAVFATSTKSDAGAPIGLTGLEAIARATTLPVAAVGGITLADVASVRACGAAMVGVVSAVAAAGSPDQMRTAAAALAASWGTSRCA